MGMNMIKIHFIYIMNISRYIYLCVCMYKIAKEKIKKNHLKYLNELL